MKMLAPSWIRRCFVVFHRDQLRDHAWSAAIPVVRGSTVGLSFLVPGSFLHLRCISSVLRVAFLTLHLMVSNPSLWCASKRWHPENP